MRSEDRAGPIGVLLCEGYIRLPGFAHLAQIVPRRNDVILITKGVNVENGLIAASQKTTAEFQVLIAECASAGEIGVESSGPVKDLSLHRNLSGQEIVKVQLGAGLREPASAVFSPEFEPSA